MQYIDSHCHLANNTSFIDVFTWAHAVGIVGAVLNSVTQYDWEKIIQIAKSNKNIRGAIGIHPWHANNTAQGWDTEMAALLRDNPLLVVGEIGLDKTRDNFVIQQRVFAQTLEIAIKYGRVINLHCVHAWDEMIKILQAYRADLPKIVIHSFDGTQNAIDCGLGLYFSYSPNVANARFKRVIASVARVPKNKILVESDSDDLVGVINAARGVLAIRHDITADDIFNNSMGVFFNG